MYLWKHKRKILFIVTRLELSVSFTDELFVAEFSGSHFQYAPKWQRTVRMKLFLKLFGIQENLIPYKNANLYLLESERLVKCCFDKNLIDGPTNEKINMKPMRWMIENKSALYFFILFLKRLWKNELAFCSHFLTLLLKLRESDVPTRNSTLLLLEYNAIFFLTRMPKLFGATNTLNFSNLSFPKLTFPTYA